METRPRFDPVGGQEDCALHWAAAAEQPVAQLAHDLSEAARWDSQSGAVHNHESPILPTAEEAVD
jgi:hypothetical protein